MGQRMASRYGASLVQAAGCPELIAQSPAQYVAIAQALAQDDEKLRKLRQSLRTMMSQRDFTDPTGMAGRLEAAYHDMAMRTQSVDIAHA